MTHAELSRDLALTLGYYPKAVRLVQVPDAVFVGIKHNICEVVWLNQWRRFDYRDPSIVVPLIKWLGDRGKHVGPVGDIWWHVPKLIAAKTPEEAVARAVIALSKTPTA